MLSMCDLLFPMLWSLNTASFFLKGQRAIRPYWKNYFEQVEILVSAGNKFENFFPENCNLSMMKLVLSWM